MVTKLEKLLRYHRANVFDQNKAKADRHERALKRLKKTKTFSDMCDSRREENNHRRSMRLLSLYN